MPRRVRHRGQRPTHSTASLRRSANNSCAPCEPILPRQATVGRTSPTHDRAVIALIACLAPANW
jgi:hypothetical protein